MAELAMRQVHPTPLLDQIKDLALLPGQQPMHRAAAGIAVLKRAGLAQPLSPAVRADIGEVKHSAAPRVRPAVRDRSVDQPQQLELGPGAHARGDRAEKPERCLPRCKVSSTASSLIASDSLSFSDRSNSSSTASTDAGRPGFAEANAASAASLPTPATG